MHSYPLTQCLYCLYFFLLIFCWYIWTQKIIGTYFNGKLMLLFHFLKFWKPTSVTKILPILRLNRAYRNKQTSKQTSREMSGTKSFGNPNRTKAAFVARPQQPYKSSRWHREERGKSHSSSRCRMFNLVLKGHHFQHMAIGLTGLTLGDSLSKYTNPWMVGASLTSCPNVNQLKGNVTGVTVWRWFSMPDISIG